MMKKIEEIIQISKGKKPKLISKVLEKGLMPYVDIKAFEQKIIDNYTDGEKCLPCEDGDLLIVCDGSRSGLVGRAVKGYVGSTLARIDIDKSVLPEYIYHFIQGKYIQLNTSIKGTGTPHLNQELLKSFELYVPPLEDQHRIVSRIEELFSQLDSSVEMLKKTKEQLKVYRQAVLKEAFDNVDEYVNFETVIVGTPQNGIYKPKSDYGFGVPILRIDGFYDGFIQDDYDYKLVNITDEELARYRLEIGNIVINRVNSMPYLGKCALVRKLNRPTVFESNMMRITLNSKLVNGEYISYYLSSLAGKKELTKNAKQAVNQASINQKDVGNALIPLPSLKEQVNAVNKIESRLSVFDSIEKTIDTALQEAEALRQSILKQAFEGGL